jgi:voltage-gated potassium channel
MAGPGGAAAGAFRNGLHTRIGRAVAAVVVVLCVGTVGYIVLGMSVVEALYQAVTTLTTIGFREVQPFGTAEMLFTIVLALVGIGTVFYAFATVMEAAVEGPLAELVGRRRMDRRIAGMSGHVVLCGWGRVGRSVVDHLEGREIVVIDTDGVRLSGLPHPTVVGDATDDAVLRAAGIERAGTLVAALSTDADNLFITLSAKALAPSLFVVARARDERSVDKLTRAGADRVVNPQELGGARMAALVAQPAVADFLDVVMHDRSIEYRLSEVTVRSPAVAGHTLREAGVRDRTGALVLAVRDGRGAFESNPGPQRRLELGDVLVAIGTRAQLDALEALACGGDARPVADTEAR